MVDVLPEEAFHEQKLGHVGTMIAECMYEAMRSHRSQNLVRKERLKNGMLTGESSYFFLRLSFGFFLPYPIMGISPSIPLLLALRPLPPVPVLRISGTQSGSIQLPPLSLPRHQRPCWLR